ncbi:MAG: MBG domain-containing protein [Clostridiales bacterium]|nr:MBG domain-containing protein [Clostridiales bacterium]
MLHTCTVCGETKIELIPATGHTFGAPTFEWADDYSSATAIFACEDEGCDNTETETAEVIHHTTPATCTEDGQTVYTATATFDGVDYTDTKTVTLSATGHSYEAVVTEATCTEDGYTTYTCSACGDSYTETIPATGHTFVDGVCTSCGEKETVDLSDYKVTVASATYTGSALTPSVTVTDEDGNTLTEGVDFTVEYSDVLLAAGSYAITIVGTGDYTGSIDATFTINKASISGYTVTLSSTSYTYDGKAKQPTATVKNGSATLSSSNYTVSYSNNTNAGTATVTVTGKGNYTGTATGKFTINKASQTVTATAAATSIYAGKTTTVTGKGTGTITYSSSDTSIATVSSSGVVTGKKPGTVTVTVKAAGNSNYNSATKAVKITVKLNSTTISSLTNTSKGITVKWSKVTGASGYYIYCNGKQVKKITSGSTVSYTDTGAKTNGAKYQYKIYAYYGSTQSAASATKTTYYVSGVSISSLKNVKTKKMTVKWGKNTKATGYQIQYSTSSDFSSCKTVTVSSYKTVSKTITSLTKGSKYYVRVRVYKTVSGTKYYSAWSSTKNVKISK